MRFAEAANESGSDSSAGTFENIRVITDDNGRASTSYTTGSSAGPVMLEARAGDVSSSSVALTVDPDAVRLNAVALTTGSSEAVADGKNTTLVRATVTDTDDKPVEGVSVAFNSTAGSLPKDMAVTDRQGTAEAQLTSPTRASTAQITASVGGINQTTDIEFVPGPISLANSSITANPSNLPADGNSTTAVTVTLADVNGNPVDDGTPVRLQANSGSIQGDNSAQTELGRTSFTLQAPNAPGQSDIRVLQQPELSATVRFGIVSTGAPSNVRVNAQPRSIAVSGVGQSEISAINLTIVDPSGDAINEAKYGDASLDNVRVSLVTKPSGGEFIAGTNAAGGSVESTGLGYIDIRSTDGTATLNLQSGIRPGIIEARIQVLDFNGTTFTNKADVAATASLPQITVASGPPNTLVFTASNNSINNDLDGIYSRRGTVIVTDRYGNTVPDGTTISLGLVDSVIAQGTGSIQANDATLSAPVADSTFDTRCSSPTNCSSAQFDLGSRIMRNGVPRGIEGNDRILIENAEAEDKGRFVSTPSTGNTNAVDAQADYVNSTGKVLYTIGASLLGAEIGGIDDEDDGVQTGTGTTTGGRVAFRVAYPANLDTIRVGCLGTRTDGSYSADDKRFTVPQSAQLLLVASASDNKATGISRNRFCFQGIAEATLAAEPTTVSSDATINLTLKDGGDGIRLPFVPISATSTITNRGRDSTFAITSIDILRNAENGKSQTGINGTAEVNIDVNCDDGAMCTSGDSATITFRGAEASANVDVDIP